MGMVMVSWKLLFIHYSLLSVLFCWNSWIHYLYCGCVSGLVVYYSGYPSTYINMTVAVQRIWGKQWLESDRMVIFDSKKCNCIICLAVLQSFLKNYFNLYQGKMQFLMFLVSIIYSPLRVAEVWVYKSLFTSSSSDLLFLRVLFSTYPMLDFK